MDFEETTNNGEGTELAEDLLLDEVVEDSEDEGPEESLDSITDEGQAAEAQESPKGKQGTGEPGYVAGRIAKAVEKAVAQVTAQYEAQMAPIRERLLEMDAKELVDSGKVKDLETAKELVRYRHGQPAVAPATQTAEQPRQANGQFAPRNSAANAEKSDPAVMARIDMLKHQAKAIKEDTGLDVVAEWNSNEEIKKAVIAGEMDFYDVAKAMKNPKKKPPSPMRSPNGVNGQIKGTIMSMSDKQFEQLEKRVREGARFRE
jgi:hypothetical protein